MLIDDPSIAVSLRNIFTGVQEKNLLLSVARHAEERGQEIHLRDETIARRASREETGRDQGRARAEGGAFPPRAHGGGEPRVSSGNGEEGVPAPTTAPVSPAAPEAGLKTGLPPAGTP